MQSDRRPYARLGFAGPWPGAEALIGSQPLAGERVRLQRLDAERHAAALHAGFAEDAATWDYLSYGPFASAADYATWMRAVQPGLDPLFLAVLDTQSIARGVTSLQRFDVKNGVCEVGHIAWTPWLRHRPEATEAVYLQAARVFALGYRRLEWKCDAGNLASRRAAQRLGFSYEGVFRQHMVVKGRNRDTAWFSITDGDWARLQPVLAGWLAPENFDANGRQRESLSALTRPLLAALDPVAHRALP